jgi:predicted DNA-binding transcriptional regulator AlpA
MGRTLSLAPAAIPTLDELAANPERASALPPAALQSLLCRCVSLQSALLGALLSATAETNRHAAEEPDSLIDVEAAAQRLGVSRDWLYHHARQLPFTVHQGRLLRFSTRGINRYIRSRQGA